MSLFDFLQTEKLDLRAGDLLLLVATAGLIAYHLFSAIGAFGIMIPSRRDHLAVDEQILAKTVLSFFHSILSVLQVSAQTAIIILSNAVSPQNSTDEAFKKYLLRFLAISNGFKWFSGSMILGCIRETDPIKKYAFTMQTWISISRTVYPMLLFYRLHSVHLTWHVADHLFGKSHGPQEH